MRPISIIPSTAQRHPQPISRPRHRQHSPFASLLHVLVAGVALGVALHFDAVSHLLTTTPINTTDAYFSNIRSPFRDECDVVQVSTTAPVGPTAVASKAVAVSTVVSSSSSPSSSSSSFSRSSFSVSTQQSSVGTHTDSNDIRSLCNTTESSTISNASTDANANSPLLSAPCWNVFVKPRRLQSLLVSRQHTSNSSVFTFSRLSERTFRRRLRSTSRLSAAEVRQLHKLDGCVSAASCGAVVRCVYGVEDPSDVFWLRRYSLSSKFVVLFNVGLVTLCYFIIAIIVDGTIFFPHRQGIALTSASALILFALAALLYVLFVPHHLQFALLGAGVWSAIAYILVVLVIATLLPAFAVVWLSAILFVLFFMGFLFEHVLLTTFATLHFVAIFLLYQAQNMALHVRLVYFPYQVGPSSRTSSTIDSNNNTSPPPPLNRHHGDPTHTDGDEGDDEREPEDLAPRNRHRQRERELERQMERQMERRMERQMEREMERIDGEQDDTDDTQYDSMYDAQVLLIAQQFLSRIRANWFMSRIPNMLEQRALQIIQNNIPDHVHEELFRRHVVHQRIDFDSIDEARERHINSSSNPSTTSNLARAQHQPTQQHQPSHANPAAPTVNSMQPDAEPNHSNSNHASESTPLLRDPVSSNTTTNTTTATTTTFTTTVPAP